MARSTGSTDGGYWEGWARRWLEDPRLQLGTSLVLFTLVSTVSATQLYLNWVSAGAAASYPSILFAEFIEWGMWALAVPMVVVVQARLYDRGARWMTILGTHLLLATAVFAVQNLVLVVVTPLVDPSASGGGLVDAYLLRAALRLSSGWVVYAFILGAVWVLQEALRRQRLTRDLYDAQLRALRAQIHPHFLFNTLHAVGALVRAGDRDQSIETLVSLSELLRRSLRHAHQDVVPLQEELDFLEIYLSIQRTRFGENLRVAMEVADEARGALVPPLMLQPLVENAIRHGLDLEEAPGTVTVRARVLDTRLQVTVEDDGGRLDVGDPVGNGDGGIGLSNLRGRLERLYGSTQSLALEATAAGTTAVAVDIPFRR